MASTDDFPVEVKAVAGGRVAVVAEGARIHLVRKNALQKSIMLAGVDKEKTRTTTFYDRTSIKQVFLNSEEVGHFYQDWQAGRPTKVWVCSLSLAGDETVYFVDALDQETHGLAAAQNLCDQFNKVLCAPA